MGDKIKISMDPGEAGRILTEYIKKKYNLKGGKSRVFMPGATGTISSFDIEIEDAEIKKDLNDVDLKD